MRATRAWADAAVATLFLASLVVLVYGFAGSRVIEDGLLAAWSPKGVRQCAAFLLASLASALVAARLPRTRAPLVALAGAWLVVAHGLAATAATALVASAALALGFRLSRRAAFGEGPFLEVALLRLVLGLAVIVAVVQLLAHFPVNTPALHLGLLGLCLWAGRAGLREAAARLGRFAGEEPAPRSAAYAQVALLVVLGLHSAMAAVPEAGSDALAVHLMVPQQVASHGLWGFDFRGFVWAVVPMGADWLYTTANLLGGEGAARLCNFGLLVVVALLVRQQVRRRLGEGLATLLVAACAAAPIAFQESFSLWVENLLTAFLLAATLVTLRTWRRARTADVAAAALCVGGAFLTKSLAVCALPLLVAQGWNVARAPGSARHRARLALLALGLFLLVGAGPYAYAYAVTGNPLFPFFNDVFRSPYFGDRFVDTRWIEHAGPDLLYRMTFQSSVYGELYDGAFGFHHLLLLPLGLLAALVRWPRAARLGLVATTATLVAFVCGTQYIRYLYPFLWIAALVEAEALGALVAIPRLRVPALAALALAFAANLAFLPTGFYLMRNFPVDTVFSKTERDWFIAVEAPYRRLNEVVNATSGRASRVLYLTEPYGAYLEGVPVYGNWHNPSVVARLGAETPEEVEALLREERITHVILAAEPELPAFRAWLGEHGQRLAALWGNELYALPSWPDAR